MNAEATIISCVVEPFDEVSIEFDLDYQGVQKSIDDLAGS
jgi:hypothetical protein